VFSLIPTQWGKVLEVANSRPIVVEAMGGGFQSLNSERLQIEWLRDRAVIASSDFQMLYVANPVFSSDRCRLYGNILREFFSVVKS
jgi:hypothetical protein